jgi:hypothetical protein
MITGFMRDQARARFRVTAVHVLMTLVVIVVVRASLWLILGWSTAEGGRSVTGSACPYSFIALAGNTVDGVRAGLPGYGARTICRSSDAGPGNRR